MLLLLSKKSNMKFFSNVLATIVGLILFSILSFFFFLMIASIFSMAASDGKDVKVKDNSVLLLKLDKPILEREIKNPFENLDIPGMEDEGIGLIELRKAIEHAKNDDNITGILLDASYVLGGFTKIANIRESLEKFKESGKFVVAASDMYTEGGYYLASVADEVIANPVYGMLEFNGLDAERMFFKGTLDKLNIQPYIFRVGDYKDAIEPFIRKDMSEPSKRHTIHLINKLQESITRSIATSRNLDPKDVQAISDSALVQSGEDALSYGLIDYLMYKDQVDSLIRVKTELEEDDKINYISYKKYSKSFSSKKSSKNRIAVIIASGEITGGKGDNNTIGSEKFTKEIRKARLNDKIKAIVLRINSPGGSAAASDVIWRELKLASKVKPVIASMSDLAASGGYYIAVGCDTIITQPGTITGSIGVFGMMFNIEGLLTNKLGVTTDHVQTGHFSDLYNATRPKTEYELQIFQKQTEMVYEVFVKKCAESRNMTIDEIKAIASGRVWTGTDAVENGLADMIGDMDKAISIAAEKAGIADDYKVSYYPAQKDPITEMIESFSGDMESSYMKFKLKEFYPLWQEMNKIQQLEGIQTRLPPGYNVHF